MATTKVWHQEERNVIAVQPEKGDIGPNGATLTITRDGETWARVERDNDERVVFVDYQTNTGDYAAAFSPHA